MHWLWRFERNGRCIAAECLPFSMVLGLSRGRRQKAQGLPPSGSGPGWQLAAGGSGGSGRKTTSPKFEAKTRQAARSKLNMTNERERRDGGPGTGAGAGPAGGQA